MFDSNLVQNDFVFEYGGSTSGHCNLIHYTQFLNKMSGQILGKNVKQIII